MIALVTPPLATAIVLGVEIELARRNPALDRATPFVLDGLFGPVGDAGPPPLRLVWLGDSTGAGVGASRPDGAVPRQVAARLGRPVRLTVLAESGDRVADVVQEQAGLVTEADVVVVGVGANDVVHVTGRGAFRSRYRRLVAALPEDARIVLLGVPDMGSPPRLLQPLRALAAWRGRALDDDIRHLARDIGATYVDIAGETGSRFRRHPGRYFSADRYHPNDAGYELWADAVLAALKAAEPDRRSGAAGPAR